MIFRKWGGGGQRRFGTFPKIHSFWCCAASLSVCAVNCVVLCHCKGWGWLIMRRRGSSWPDWSHNYADLTHFRVDVMLWPGHTSRVLQCNNNCRERGLTDQPISKLNSVLSTLNWSPMMLVAMAVLKVGRLTCSPLLRQVRCNKCGVSTVHP